MLLSPSDWQDPQWGVYERIHGWRNYVSDEVKALWPTFTLVQRETLAACFEEIAGQEHWD